MRRSGPRPVAAALGDFAADVAPVTLLARVQGVWKEVAGAVLAREATPSGERGGEVRMACRSASWAHELTLMEPELRERLNVALAGSSESPVTTIRFRCERGERVPPGVIRNG